MNAITLRCKCGKTLKARAESSGKRIRCRFCGATLTVPNVDRSGGADEPSSEQPPTPQRASSRIGTILKLTMMVAAIAFAASMGFENWKQQSADASLRERLIGYWYCEAAERIYHFDKQTGREDYWLKSSELYGRGGFSVSKNRLITTGGDFYPLGQRPAGAANSSSREIKECTEDQLALEEDDHRVSTWVRITEEDLTALREDAKLREQRNRESKNKKPVQYARFRDGKLIAIKTMQLDRGLREGSYVYAIRETPSRNVELILGGTGMSSGTKITISIPIEKFSTLTAADGAARDWAGLNVNAELTDGTRLQGLLNGPEWKGKNKFDVTISADIKTMASAEIRRGVPGKYHRGKLQMKAVAVGGEITEMSEPVYMPNKMAPSVGRKLSDSIRITKSNGTGADVLLSDVMRADFALGASPRSIKVRLRDGSEVQGDFSSGLHFVGSVSNNKTDSFGIEILLGEKDLVELVEIFEAPPGMTAAVDSNIAKWKSN